jgi:hemolysin activation/secretion protein
MPASSSARSLQNYASIGWQTPIGYYGTQIGVSFERLNYSLIKTFASVQAEGDATVTTLTASQQLLRSSNLNLSLFANYDKNSIENHTLGFNDIETGNINLLGSFKAQWDNKNLLSTEKIALGDANDVRACPGGEASSDQGYVGALSDSDRSPRV